MKAENLASSAYSGFPSSCTDLPVQLYYSMCHVPVCPKYNYANTIITCLYIQELHERKSMFEKAESIPQNKEK